MAETTVWACKKCGRSGKGGERCHACSGSMGCITESEAIRRFMEYWEPPTGWYSDEVMRQDWRNDSVSIEYPGHSEETIASARHEERLMNYGKRAVR